MRNRNKKPKIYELKIAALSDEGRGIAYSDDKTIFVDGALIGEKVLAERTRNRAKIDEAKVIEVLTPSKHRISPKCAVYGVCGGCSLQHLSSEAQVNIKQKWLENALLKQAKIKPQQWLKPLQAEVWNYRRKARLSVRYVEKKAKVLVGFRERKSKFITDMSRCEVLHPLLGEHLADLAQCIEKLSIKQFIPQIEVAIGENEAALVLRHLRPITDNDKQQLAIYAEQLNFTWLTQSGNLDTIKPLDKPAALTYSHPKHKIEMAFLPTDFTQVNFNLNQKMVDLALQLLNLKNTDKVIDLFCGLGNFTLPIARYTGFVVGVEGSSSLIKRAKQNALRNLINNVDFYQADLSKDPSGFEWCRGKTYNKALIDPAREGAFKLIELLPKLGVKTLAYISCNPATLARDSQRLSQLGYTLKTAGIMDMFPHTAHIECITLFEHTKIKTISSGIKKTTVAVNV